MSEFGKRISNAGAPLLALEAATNWRAMAMLMATMVAFVILIAGGVLTGSPVLIGIMTLVGLLVILTGNSATGYMLMDQARGLEQRSFLDAILASIFTLHRVLGVMLLAGLIYVAILIVVSILLAVCKIPGIGPLLYTFTFPVSAVAIGVTFLTLFYVSPTILGPSIWEGNGVVASMARLWTIARHKLLSVVMNLFLLTLVLFFISFVIWAIVLLGSMSTLGLSVKIIGYEAGGMNPMGIVSEFMSMFSGYGGMGSGNGYATAILIAFLMLYAIAISIPAVVGISGACHIYLQNSEGLDFEASEAQINKGMQEAKRRAMEAQARAQQAAQQAAERTKATAASASSAAATPAGETVCPKCGIAITPEDTFCGECGQRLKD